MDYAKQLERIEAKKARDRKNSNLKNSKSLDTAHGPTREKGGKQWHIILITELRL